MLLCLTTVYEIDKYLLGFVEITEYTSIKSTGKYLYSLVHSVNYLDFQKFGFDNIRNYISFCIKHRINFVLKKYHTDFFNLEYAKIVCRYQHMSLLNFLTMVDDPRDIGKKKYLYSWEKQQFIFDLLRHNLMTQNVKIMDFLTTKLKCWTDTYDDFRILFFFSSHYGKTISMEYFLKTGIKYDDIVVVFSYCIENLYHVSTFVKTNVKISIEYFLNKSIIDKQTIVQIFNNNLVLGRKRAIKMLIKHVPQKSIIYSINTFILRNLILEKGFHDDDFFLVDIILESRQDINKTMLLELAIDRGFVNLFQYVLGKCEKNDINQDKISQLIMITLKIKHQEYETLKSQNRKLNDSQNTIDSIQCMIAIWKLANPITMSSARKLTNV